MAFYPAIPASDGTSLTAPTNAEFKVYEVYDTARANPLPLQSTAGMNAAPLVTTAQGVLPPVNVVSPNFRHVFASGGWEWERQSFDGAQEATEAAAQEAVAARRDAGAAAMAAKEAAEAAWGPSDIVVDMGIQRANIPGIVTRTVAGQPTVTAAAATAAAAAVDTAAKSADLITGRDPRVAIPLEAGTGWAHPFADSLGRIAGGFTEDGIFRLAQPLDAPSDGTVEKALIEGDVIAGADSRAPVYIEPGTGWAHPFTDGLGRVAGGFTEAGTWRLAQPLDAPSLTSSRTRVACIGDSLVRGYTGGTVWPLEDAWPAHLSKLLPGVEVANGGYGGNTVDDVRFRTGAMKLYAEIEGGTIPASGPVNAIVRQQMGMVLSREDIYYGTLAGVAGDLIRSTSGKWTFTRRSAGAPVSVVGRQPVLRNDLYPNHTTLVWVGRNDVSYDARGRDVDVVEHVVGSIVGLVEHQRAHEKQFGVVSILNRVDEPKGTPKYEQIIQINERLAALFPGRFLNLRPWLVKQAIYDAGLTPTAADLEAIAADSPPPQIMDGGSHYVKAIAPLLAGKFYEYLTEKGYC